MYCTRCGKQIDYESTICDECLGKSIRNGERVSMPTPPKAPEEGAPPRQATPAYADPIVKPVNQTSEHYGNAVSTVSTKTEVVNKNDRMYKFGKALTSAIFAFAAMSFFVILMSVAEYEISLITTASLFGIGLAIPGLVNGIVALTSVVSYKNENNLTPIAPMVLSIVGVAYSGICILVSFGYLVTCFTY